MGWCRGLGARSSGLLCSGRVSCQRCQSLFFGDLDAYLTSPLRVVTNGLNPSLREFPSAGPFFPFQLGAGEDRGRYLEALSAYFRTDPYAKWFGAAQRDRHQLLRVGDLNGAAHLHLLAGGHRPDLERTQRP